MAEEAAAPEGFTRRHFDFVAATLRHELEHVACGEDQRDMARSIALAFADGFESSNPRFDRARFLKACGVAA